MYSIGIRYCGGCNPQIDRSKVIRNLKEGLKKIGMEVDFTTDRQSAVDLILLINGCMHACLEEKYVREADNPQFISVKGEMVDTQYVKEDYIPEILIKKIADLLNSASH
jgi:hypothetical protein